MVDDTINEPIQNLALVVSVNPKGMENKICFSRGLTGSCQGHNGSTLLKIIDNDRMSITFMVPFVHSFHLFCLNGAHSKYAPYVYKLMTLFARAENKKKMSNYKLETCLAKSLCLLY